MALIKHGNNALSSVTAFPSAVPTGKPVLLSTVTASSSSSIEFTSEIDSTYDVYHFKIVNIHPATNDVNFQINFRDGGSNFDATKTTTFFQSLHTEVDGTGLSYSTPNDLAQSTGNQNLCEGLGGDADESFCGDVYLFNPSSTTFVKHFISTNQFYQQSNQSRNTFVAGYCNVTAAIDGVKFVMSSGNIEVGTIKMYGISAWVWFG